MAAFIDTCIAELVRGERVFVVAADEKHAAEVFRLIKRRVTPAMLKRLQLTPEPAPVPRPSGASQEKR